MPLTSPSVMLLVAVNLLPLGGVLFFGWTVFDLLALFWAENVVIGLINLVKMGYVCVLRRDRSGLFFMPFFVIHYGIFTQVHGFFIYAMFAPPGEIDLSTFYVPLAALALGHLGSFFLNFIGRREYETLDASRLMSQPYARVVVLHVAILVGAVAVSALGAPLYALAALVVVKTGIDLAAHRREHEAAAMRLKAVIDNKV